MLHGLKRKISTHYSSPSLIFYEVSHKFSFLLYFIKCVFWGESASVNNRQSFPTFTLIMSVPQRKNITVSETFWKFTTSLPITQVQVTPAAGHTPHVSRPPACCLRRAERPCPSHFSLFLFSAHFQFAQTWLR